MTEKMEHFDENLDLKISPKLSSDLRALFESKQAVPPEIDRTIIHRVHQHFNREGTTQTRQRRFRWVAFWKVAAAAAVIIFAFSLDLTQKPRPVTGPPVLASFEATDIDLNGRVDILDAFTLARQIENTGHIESEWDINGDGRVDHSDVDTVALAAVRLDKGVL